MTHQPYDYSARQGIHPISWEDFHGLCKALALAIARFQPEIILPIGRGGYYPGTLIAHMLQVDLYSIRVSRRVNDVATFQTPQWLIEPPASVRSHRVLIVDEICSAGETLTLVKDKVLAMGASAVRCAVLYAHSWGVKVPDYIGLVTDELLLNPWDREIVREGIFQLHPEYGEALAQQGIKPTYSLLIQAPHFELAKSTDNEV